MIEYQEKFKFDMDNLAAGYTVSVSYTHLDVYKRQIRLSHFAYRNINCLHITYILCVGQISYIHQSIIKRLHIRNSLCSILTNKRRI